MSLATEKDATVTAAQTMMGCVNAIKTSLEVIRATFINTIKGTNDLELSDIAVSINSILDYLNGCWGETPQKVHPLDTQIYKLCKSVAWNFRHIIHNYTNAIGQQNAKELLTKLYSTNGAWPLEIPFEVPFKDLLITFNQTVQNGNKAVSYTYTNRQPTIGSVGYTYPGLALTIEKAHEALFYQSVFPIGKILNVIRNRAAAREIGPLAATNYIGAVIFSYYEIIVRTREYFVALKQHLILNGEDEYVSECDFPYFELPIGNESDPDQLSWYKFLKKARDEAQKVSRTYLHTINKARPKDLLGSLTADDIKNPDRVASAVGNILGIGDLNMDTIKSLPGVGSLISSLSTSQTANEPPK